MAKVEQPLFSITAKGNIKKTIVFTSFRGQARVKWFKASPDARSHAQLLQRGIYSEAVDVWNEMSVEQKAPFQELAKGQYKTGYNLFLSDYLLTHEITEAFNFAYLVSLFFGIHIFLWSDIYEDETMMNMLFEWG